MPRVVPSQVVLFITTIHADERDGVMSMHQVGPANLSAVLALLDEIPDELITIGNETYGSLVRAKERIKEVLATWTSNKHAGHPTENFQFHRSANPLAHISDALAQCPDESPAP